jgi:hypothetical protein
MIAAILAWLAVVALPLILILVLKSFPKLLGDVIIKELEHRHNIRLEQIKSDLGRENAVQIETLKAEMTAAYSTLKSSVDFLSASQGEVREKRVDAIGKLWHVLLSLERAFSDVFHVEAILSPLEIDEFFRTGNVQKLPKIKTYLAHLEEYRQDDTVLKKWQSSDAETVDIERLFVSARLWQIAFVLRALYARVGMLFNYSFKERRYNNWRDDEHLLQMLSSVLPTSSVAQAKAMEEDGLKTLVLTLHNDFLEEAEKIMSGVHSLSKSIADVQTTLLGEKDKLTAEMRGDRPM